MKEHILETLAVASDPDVVAAVAQYTRRLYDALRAQGFSDDDAVRIVVANCQKPN